ncbi:SDR family oxidoreductase [Cytophagaceae bacterium YF14B1]|uniref:SDR family oxidoreductase n=1 Tax=Xanthocytophaga flava TaxID=3048013 RepID=A0AAE3U609_9BACT|nr:SDR family oxidoreductase [Xanthocytophaga flavus]MDJ1480856.1 SDR family oxidoreductase [Xanthocytophaga flavus]
MTPILVTGATGHLGSVVTQTLKRTITARQIGVITRHEEKRAELESQGFTAHLADYDHPFALEKAMDGVDTVLLISAGDEGDRMQQHRNVVDAAKRAGVKNIAYTSRALKDRTTLSNALMRDHFETEDYIKESGLTYTLFRNILYMDAIPLFIGKQALERGIFLPAGEGKVSFALRREMGEAMALVLANEPCQNKTYHFTGREAYSFGDIAQALTELSGKLVSYTPAETPVFVATMRQRGIAEPMLKKIVDFVTDIRHNQEADVYTDLEKVLGRQPLALKDGLKELFGL